VALLVFWEGKKVPGHRVHTYIDRQCFGKTYWKIHRKIDEPVLYLGKNHRALFHDYPTAWGIAEYCYPGDPNARNAAMLHIELDEMCTRNPEFKLYLEALATQDAQQRKQTKRRTRNKLVPLPKVYKEQDDFFNKILKVQRWRQLLCSS
jgi:hypothetical protein